MQLVMSLSNEFNGIDWCEYQNNVFNGKDYSKELEELKEIVYSVKKPKRSLESVCARFIKREKEYSIGSIENKNIALYLGDKEKTLLDKAKERLKQKRAKYISFGMEDRLAGQTIVDINPEFAYKKAGRIMLEAFDSGVEVLACVNRDDYNYFKSIHKFAEREAGRDIDLNIMALDI